MSGEKNTRTRGNSTTVHVIGVVALALLLPVT
jgi:hypothetical protein